jgi:hypothetical protein
VPADGRASLFHFQVLTRQIGRIRLGLASRELRGFHSSLTSVQLTCSNESPNSYCMRNRTRIGWLEPQQMHRTTCGIQDMRDATHTIEIALVGHCPYRGEHRTEQRACDQRRRMNSRESKHQRKRAHVKA